MANHIIEIGGSFALACGGKILADLPLLVAELMSEMDAAKIVEKNRMF